MINLVALEGIITRGCWRYGGTRFLRLACYLDPDRMHGNGADEPHYVTVRCEGPLALVAANLKEGDRVQVQGALCSRGYEIPLKRYVRKAHGPAEKLDALRKQAAVWAEVHMPHTLNEIVAERLVLVERHAPSGRSASRQQAAGTQELR